MNRWAYATIVAIAVATLLAYFVRPKAPNLEFVSPRQELPEFEERLPGDTSLSQRVASSYGLALVLVQSPYTQENVIALDALRGWARQQFHTNPDFLHPLTLESDFSPHQTVIGSLLYNLTASVRYPLEGAVSQLVKVQIARFHETNAYHSIRYAFFDLFGVDDEAATLLARYQTQRAKMAVSVLVWTIFWLVALTGGLLTVLTGSNQPWAHKIRIALAYGWLLLSLSYFIAAWQNNQVSVLISALVCLGVGCYLRKPFVYHPGVRDNYPFRFITLTSGNIALAFWLTYSLVCIQVLTWIRTGTLQSPDPITLLLCSLTGNFLHDPASVKRIIMQGIGMTWIVLTIWATRQVRKSEQTNKDPDSQLKPLPYDQESIKK